MSDFLIVCLIIAGFCRVVVEGIILLATACEDYNVEYELNHLESRWDYFKVMVVLTSPSYWLVHWMRQPMFHKEPKEVVHLGRATSTDLRVR